VSAELLKAAAWNALVNASDFHSNSRTRNAAQQLSDAADAWYVLRKGTPSAAAPSSGGLVFPPYGRSKGLPVAGASKGDLEFYKSGCERTLADPSKERFHAKERALLAAIDAELSK
jgi:hypothetical protein